MFLGLGALNQEESILIIVRILILCISRHVHAESFAYLSGQATDRAVQIRFWCGA